MHDGHRRRGRGRAALDQSDCEREQWVRIFMAVKAALGDARPRDCRARGAKAATANARDAFRDTWRSINEGGGIGPATLFRAGARCWLAVGCEPPPRGRRSGPWSAYSARAEAAHLALARDIWERVGRGDASVGAHPYAIRNDIRTRPGRGVPWYRVARVGQNMDCIVVPQRTLDGELLGVESVDAEGASNLRQQGRSDHRQ